MHTYTPLNKSNSKFLSSVQLPNKTHLPILGTAFLGIFPILIIPQLTKPLISEIFLITHYDILIIKYDTTTYIIDAARAKICTNTNPTDYIIAQANLSHDGLHYINNIYDLAYASPQPKSKHVTFLSPQATNVITTSKNLSHTKSTLTNHKLSHTRGRYQGRFNHLLHDLNPLEVLKIRLGFLGTHNIRHIVKKQSINGLDTTHDDIKHIHIKPSLAEYKGRMNAFPIYPALSNNPHIHLFETWSVDDVPMPVISIERYSGYFSFVEKSTRFRYAIGYTHSISELPDAITKLVQKFGSRSNPKCKPLRVLILDGSLTNTSNSLNNLCNTINTSSGPIVQRHVSAPYKHEQNLIESHIQHEKNSLRTNLAYNNAPPTMWFKALRYSHRNINLTFAPNTHISRQEAMTNIRPDVSHYTPFYAKGYAHITKAERTDTLCDKAHLVYMVGYGDDLDEGTFPDNIQYKRSFQCYKPPNQILIRHDVIWEHLSPQPSLLNEDFKDRFVETFKISPEEITSHGNSSRTKQIQQSNENESNSSNTDTQTQNSNELNPNLVHTNNNESSSQIYIEPNNKELTSIITESSTPIEENELNYNYYVDKHGNRITDRVHTRNDWRAQYWNVEFQPILQHKQPSSPNTNSTDKYTPNNFSSWIETKINPQAFNTNINESLTNFNQSSFLTIDEQGKLKLNQIKQNTTNKNNENCNTSTHLINIFNDYNNSILKILHINKNKLTNNCNPQIKNNKHSLHINNTQTDTNQNSLKYNPFTIHTPLTLQEALKLPDGDKWKQAWDEEMTRLESRSTWEVYKINPTEKSTKPIKSKYVFKIKVNTDGSVRYKVRLCACGYSQKYGIDYDETFAPTAKFKSVTTILSIAAMFKWHLTGIDVENAFVEAKLDRPILMNLPTAVYSNTDGSPLTVKLRKSLYGLKQAPELWDKFLVSVIKKLGFKQFMHDQCVFQLQNSNNERVIIIKYVDDIIITGNSSSLIDTVIDHFEKSFTKITHDEEIKRYVGLDIDYDKNERTIKLSQKPYIQKLLNKFQVTKTQSDFSIPISPIPDYRILGNDDNPAMRDLTGSLRFLADRTAPHILTACSLLSSAAHNPHKSHIKAGQQIINYLHSNQNIHITLGGDPHINLFGYADAAHISNHDSKSQLGFCFYLNTTSGAIIAKSKRDSTVSHSSTEAEIKAIDLAIREATWLRGFLSELGFTQDGPTPIYTDNNAAVILSQTNNISDLTAHLVLRINYIHQEQKSGNIKLVWINTENNVSDILTKPLPFPLFSQHSQTLLHGHNGQIPGPASTTRRDTKRQRKLNKTSAINY